MYNYGALGIFITSSDDNELLKDLYKNVEVAMRFKQKDNPMFEGKKNNYLQMDGNLPYLLSRDWVRYEFGDAGFTLGSFNLQTK